MVALRRRFRFHFLSDKPTNESSRPEWYFSQVCDKIHLIANIKRSNVKGLTHGLINIL